MAKRRRDESEHGEEPLGAEGSSTLLGDVGALDDRVPRDTAAATGAALTHLFTACAVLAVLAMVPYASEQLRTWQPWVSGEGVPLVRMFTGDEAVEGGMAVATGGAVSRLSAAPTEARIAEQLGAAVASNLTDDEAPARAVLAAPDAGGEADTGPSVRIDPSELEGLVLEIEDPEGRAMAPFYEALVHTAEREAGAITRVAHYGDSSIAGDGITMTLRRRFQQRFGDAGHGFILIARGTMPYHHVDVDHTASDDWTLVQLIRSGLRDHLYGYGGVQYRGGSGDTARFETSDRGPIGHTVSHFELWFQRHPRGGRVDLSVDRGERVEVSTRGEEVTDDWHMVDVPDGDHRLDLRTVGGGESHLYGMVLERDGPGVVYDSLGMVGARARRMLGYDFEHFRRQHAHRQTNLIVLGFGGNDADDARTPEQFETDFRRVARMVRRARPEAACLLMAPLDQAQRDDRGSIATIDQVPVIVEAQRRAALAEGCAFFDTYGAMGGEGSMRRWYRSTPRLAFADFRHATPEGYRVIGNMLYKAMLKGFADYLEREGQPAQVRRVQSTAAQSRPAQSRPAQSRPAQSRPAQSTPAQGRPAQGQPVQSRPAQSRPAPR